MEPNEKLKNQIIDKLIGEKNSGAEIQDWLHQSAENKKSFTSFRKIWKAVDFISNMRGYNTQKAWSVVDQSIQKQNIRKLRIQKAAYAVSGMAASLVLILGLAFYTGMLSVNSNQMKLATEYGSRTELSLPDGSIVTLNSGSNIEYSYNKLTNIREVKFNGEAFFKVAKSSKPFVIYTKEGMELKVLGTSFNLSSYPEDNLIETTLIEGKVELTNPNGEKLILAPGQIASYNKSSFKLAYQKGIPAHEMGWLNHKIYLDNTSLVSLSKKLERRFDVHFKMNAELGNEIHYTGVLEEGTIVEVMDALSELSDIRYKMKGKEIELMKK